MKYVLVEDKQYVLLGPIEWRPRMIQNEIDSLDIIWTVPPVEQGYISITDRYEIYPISDIQIPNHNGDFEELAGPFYTFDNKQATATYNVVNQNINNIKTNLKNKITAERYRREIAGTKITLNSTEYSIETDRDNRAKWIQLANLSGPINWKINGSFITVTNLEATAILEAVNSYVQTQFDWEKTMYDLIDSKVSIDDLKTVEMPTVKLIGNI